MRAWQLVSDGEPADVLKRANVPILQPGPGQVLIDVLASALGLPDVFQCRGTYPILPPRPMTPGLEFCGTVIAVGEGVTTAVGARVMGTAAFFTGHGAFADKCLASATSVWPVAQGMSAAEAAGFTIAFHTAWLGLVRRAGMRAGETVLVHGGAGGVGSAAIRLAKALGARVISTSGGAAKTEVCSHAGADRAIDHLSEDWLAAVLQETGGRGVDLVYDPVGGEMFEKSLECLASEGRLLPIGYASGRWGQVSFSDLNRRNASIVGALGGGGWLPRDEMVIMHQQLLDIYAAGKVKTDISREIAFDDIPEGLTALANRGVLGRIVALHR